MSATLRLGLVGFGKIARDEHVPAIGRTAGLQLIAVAGPGPLPAGFKCYADLPAMLAGEADLDCILLSQPPQARFEAARQALKAGKHVFLEKPPGVTLSEVQVLLDLARAQGVTLFAGWHSRWSQPVAEFRHWCATRTIRRVTINWKEDVRRWHPGQQWIWDAGGFGVFDPGINALSILTEVLAERIRLLDARLEIPANRRAPIGARLSLETAGGAPVTAVFDWRQQGPQVWEIVADSDAGVYRFAQGGEGAHEAEPRAESTLGPEYRAMYAHFMKLVAVRAIDVDLAPLQLVADAYLRGRIEQTAAFEDAV